MCYAIYFATEMIRYSLEHTSQLLLIMLQNFIITIITAVI